MHSGQGWLPSGLRAMADYTILVPPPRRRGPLLIGLVVVVVVASVGVVAFVAGRHNTGNHHAGGAVIPPTTVPAKALTVVSTVPAAGATEVPSDQVVSVKFSSAVSGAGGMPTLTPPVAGTWKRVGSTTFAFSAGAPFIPTSSETLTIPAGETGPHGASGAVLTTPVSASFTVAQASTERLQQLLGQLNYLPLSFTPTSSLSSPNEAATAQSGSFAWRWPGTPASLTSLWTEGSENLITKGAVMNFENQHGLKVDGLAGSRVWSALLADAAAARVNVNAYNYVFVSKQIPENLTLFSNGAPVLANIAVNTGAPGADTTDGTYPVFEHVPSSRMQGTNPDGSTYDDPNVPWASYFNGGDALHGFVRATYGTPQSNGCVEMPIADAARVWPLTPLGTLVTVAGPSS
jgi:peptidoglycan hydrolase-like protein with peptidoglycan-binding domain